MGGTGLDMVPYRMRPLGLHHSGVAMASCGMQRRASIFVPWLPKQEGSGSAWSQELGP